MQLQLSNYHLTLTAIVHVSKFHHKNNDQNLHIDDEKNDATPNCPAIAILFKNTSIIKYRYEP